MIVQLFPLFCGLATVCFCACLSNKKQLVFIVLGFMAFLVLSQWRLPGGQPLLAVNPEELAIVCAVVALTILKSQRWRASALFVGGTMAAIWLTTFESLGMAPIAAAAIVISISGFSSYRAINSKSFVTEQVMDEALIGVFLLSLVMGLLPSIVQGWQSASVLHGLDASQGFYESVSILWLAVLFTACGVVWGWWRQRQLVRQV